MLCERLWHEKKNTGRAHRPSTVNLMSMMLLVLLATAAAGCQWQLRKLTSSSYTPGFIAGSKQHQIQLEKRDSDNIGTHPHYRVVSLSGSSLSPTDSPC
jgi:outer membrane lipopolysaccharide assembly protein LptE/RlpB